MEEEVSPMDVFDWVTKNVPPAAEVVFLGGNGLRAVGAIQALEESLGKPVLTANQVLLWKALRLLKVTDKVTKYGVIFSSHPRQKEIEPTKSEN
jgi:maleate isomerase